MEQALIPLEYILSLQFLVDLGEFWIARCADIGGTWDANTCVTDITPVKVDG